MYNKKAKKLYRNEYVPLCTSPSVHRLANCRTSFGCQMCLKRQSKCPTSCADLEWGKGEGSRPPWKTPNLINSLIKIKNHKPLNPPPPPMDIFFDPRMDHKA